MVHKIWYTLLQSTFVKTCVHFFNNVATTISHVTLFQTQPNFTHTHARIQAHAHTHTCTHTQKITHMHAYSLTHSLTHAQIKNITPIHKLFSSSTVFCQAGILSFCNIRSLNCDLQKSALVVTIMYTKGQVN